MYLFVNALEKKLNQKRPRVLDIQIKSDIMGTRVKPWIMNGLESFYNCYRCNHFSEYDFQFYFMKNLIDDEDFIKDTKKWDSDKVQNITDELIEKEIKKDESKLLEIAKIKKIKDEKKFFEINNDGESLVYKFYANKIISIQFLIKYSESFIDDDKQSEKHKKIVRIVKIMNKINTRRKVK